MKIRAFIGCLLVFTVLPSLAQSGAQPAAKQPAAAQFGIDSAKEADIRRLLQMSGVEGLMKQMVDQQEKAIKPLLTSSLPPGEYREKLVDLFFQKFHSNFDLQHMIDMSVAVYDKHLTRDDIKGLIQFYSTPLGRKTINVLPQMMTEMQQRGQEWGEQVGRDSMQEVLTEHPDLQKAMEAASKSPQQ